MELLLVLLHSESDLLDSTIEELRGFLLHYNSTRAPLFFSIMRLVLWGLKLLKLERVNLELRWDHLFGAGSEDLLF